MGLDTVEFILWAENEFEIDIPDQEAENILTVGQFTTYVYHKLFESDGSHTISESELFERIKFFLVSEFKISSDRISYSSRFVKDLGLDQ